MTSEDSQGVVAPPVRPAERYRGPDRRSSMVGTPTFNLGLPIVAVAVVAALSIVAILLAPSVEPTMSTTSTVARIILAVAGLAGVLRWRLDRLGRSYWYGLAALAAALPLLTLSAPGRTLDAMTFGAYLVTVPLAWFGCRSPEVDAARRIGRTVGWALPLAAIGFLIGSIESKVFHDAIHGIVAVALIVLAARALLAAGRGGTINGRWYLPTLVATAIGASVAPFVHGSVAEYAITGPSLLVAAGVAFTGAIAEFHLAAARHQGLVLAATIARDDEAERRTRQEEAVASQLHEVRSRVAAIEGGVSVLHADDVDDLSDAVKLEIERLRKLVAPAARDDVGPFNVLDALRPTLVVAASSWPVDFAIPEDLVAIGRSDDLAQVVHGLIHNATKYASGSPIEVTAVLDGDHVLVAVDDHGPGVARGERDLIFERGWQGSRDGGGFGLGLAIAREVMTAAGGDLWVAPRPGGGARFTASLPVWAGLTAVDADGLKSDPAAPDLSDDERALAMQRLGGLRGTP